MYHLYHGLFVTARRLHSQPNTADRVHREMVLGPYPFYWSSPSALGPSGGRTTRERLGLGRERDSIEIL